MAKKFLVSINLNKNEIQNFVIHPLASAPLSPVDGQMYYNTSDNKIYLYVESTWVDITGRVVGIATTTAAVTIDNTDPTTPSISIADATGVNSGLMSSADFTKLSDATSAATASTLVERDVNGDAAFNELVITGNVTINGTPSVATDAATKGYVDGLVSGGVAIQGGIDASTNPNYPTATNGQGWYITVAGKIGGAAGPNVEVGDLIVCHTDTPSGDHATVGNDFLILQNNIGQATETTVGYAEIATDAEVSTGTDDTKIVTPAKLATALSGVGTGTVNKFETTVGNGTNTQFTVNHALGEQFCQVDIFDATTHEQVEADVTLTDANNCSVEFSVAPTTNEFRVVVIG